MIEVVGVKYKEDGRTYFYAPKGYKLNEGEKVVVDETNQKLGIISLKNQKIDEKILKSPLKSVLRIATKKDIKNYERNKKEAINAKIKCQELSDKLNLNINILDATFSLDREKLTFRFISDTRVDFRELVKSLASIYKTRIELRQIGIRDKAREIGGIGPCGQELCCHRFLRKIGSVTINEAKNQNISLNPSKINGVCGRLKCCLMYEDETYTCMRKNLKKIGDKVQTEFGEGIIKGLNILKQEYKVEVKDYGMVTIPKDGSIKWSIRIWWSQDLSKYKYVCLFPRFSPFTPVC